MMVALGIGCDGRKAVLGLREGATENTAVVNGLLIELVERGRDFSTPRLYILDGGKVLHAAVRRQAGEAAFIQRCQVQIAGRDPRLPEGWKVPPGQVPASPVARGQAWRGNRSCRSRPDT